MVNPGEPWSSGKAEKVRMLEAWGLPPLLWDASPLSCRIRPMIHLIHYPVLPNGLLEQDKMASILPFIARPLPADIQRYTAPNHVRSIPIIVAKNITKNPTGLDHRSL